jgi:hypothetical protein
MLLSEKLSSIFIFLMPIKRATRIKEMSAETILTKPYLLLIIPLPLEKGTFG